MADPTTENSAEKTTTPVPAKHEGVVKKLEELAVETGKDVEHLAEEFAAWVRGKKEPAETVGEASSTAATGTPEAGQAAAGSGEAQ